MNYISMNRYNEMEQRAKRAEAAYTRLESSAIAGEKGLKVAQARVKELEAELYLATQGAVKWREQLADCTTLREQAEAALADAASAIPFVAGSIENRIRVYRDDMQRRITSAEAERDALRADAERFEWLRRKISGAEYRRLGIVYSDTGMIRAAIDAAREKP